MLAKVGLDVNRFDWLIRIHGLLSIAAKTGLSIGDKPTFFPKVAIRSADKLIDLMFADIGTTPILIQLA
ncbi:MAG: hypothetical protein OXE84_12805 [Rhodobacteraceae bacterium]|nr:hypothetical protein [Paracoccaceae bacterium]